ncbi:MAG TPA: SDR family NAD(P)-dependent oxidoreductase, partial [Acidobacteriaceae bacterium]|nr:SDR family NAD(P)-dependent oxidoreductase [Acidobacteriaceae bacterium]
MKLAGKVAIVTGAASGIGRASAIAFAREGAAVVVADKNAAAAEETAALIRLEGFSAISIVADVARESSVEAMVAQTAAQFGAIHIL